MLLAILVGLIEYTQKKPLATGTTGALVGFGGWLVNWLEMGTRFFQFGAGFFACLVGAASFFLILPKLCRAIRRTWTHGITNADKDAP
jgi:hypothetical protein